MLNKQRLLTPGPTPLPEEVRLALAQDMIHHRKARFQEIMERVQKSLQQLFGCSTPVLPLSCSGTGAMTAAVYSLFSPGQTVLTVEAGKFGERWREISESRGLKVVSMPVEWGMAASPERISALLRKNPEIAGVLIQMSETSTGVLNPLAEISAAISGTNALLVVDGISGVGISPCPMDAWGLDCLLTGSQKGLMLPPGLALIALSERAWRKAQNVVPGCYYFDLVKERANLGKFQTRFTSPVNLIMALEASLKLLLNKGLNAVYQKQWALTSLVRAGAAAIGLELLAKENFGWGVTAVRMPDGIDAGKIIKACMETYGIILAGGQDQLKGRIIRIGHMGWVDWGDCMAALCAISSTLAGNGFNANADFAPAALAAYNEALQTPFP